MAASAPAAAADPVDLSTCDTATGLAWLASIDTLLLDCDGVVWRGSEGVAGVSASVAALLGAGKRIFYVSNNSTKSRADYVAKLASVCGIEATGAQIVTSAVAAAAYCRAHGVHKAYVVGQSGLVEELTAAGVTVLGPSDGSRTFAFGSMAPSQLDAGVQAVVVGFDGAASYYKIATAASYLRYGGPPAVLFVATNRDITFPDTHMLVPGGGVLVGAVEAGAGRSPDVVAGKPDLAMLDILVGTHSLDRHRTVMVGDRLDTDILFGTDGGLAATLLVLTGVSSAADVAALPAGDGRTPTHILPSLGDLPALLERWGVGGGGAAAGPDAPA